MDVMLSAAKHWKLPPTRTLGIFVVATNTRVVVGRGLGGLVVVGRGLGGLEVGVMGF